MSRGGEGEEVPLVPIREETMDGAGTGHTGGAHSDSKRNDGEDLESGRGLLEEEDDDFDVEEKYYYEDTGKCKSARVIVLPLILCLAVTVWLFPLVTFGPTVGGYKGVPQNGEQSGGTGAVAATQEGQGGDSWDTHTGSTGQMGGGAPAGEETAGQGEYQGTETTETENGEGAGGQEESTEQTGGTEGEETPGSEQGGPSGTEDWQNGTGGQETASTAEEEPAGTEQEGETGTYQEEPQPFETPEQHYDNEDVVAAEDELPEPAETVPAFPVSGVTWRSGFFQANGMEFKFYETVPPKDSDQIKRKLVWFHGLTSSGAVLIPLFTLLAESFDIFLPDARGHGGSSDLPIGSFTMTNLISDALSAMGFAAGGKPVFIGGHSMGASVAAHVAQFAPAHVRAVVLEDPPWLRMPFERAEFPNRPLPPFFQKAIRLQEMSEETFSAMNMRSSELPPFAMTGLQALRQFNASVIEGSFLTADDKINAAVDGITVPVHLQTGGARGVCDPMVAKRVMMTWTNGEEVNFPRAGHLIHLPPYQEEWLKDVETFYNSHLLD
eukprot:TRINITY_DN9643_c0_g1_i1.p1 TRINITY_DN9643_c0_g1~~TRINITY_DN9643_c0_g1_i1.p1  ORF type:complete len:552 (-),score=80.19 TRINITY_DN9643_c0_g1_i1:69-1724(-)